MKQALVVDDHPIMRGGVRDLLQQAFPMLLIKESAGGDGVVEEICRSDWAFVVLDISLPGGNGIEILKKAKAVCPDVPIVVYSLFPEAQFAARALRAGAAAYLAKDREAHELVAAVKMALDGKPTKKPRGSSQSRPMLSDREIQVLTLFGKGMSRKETAELLRINAKTVSTYKARLLQKLGLRNLAELVRYATDEKLVE